MDKPDSCLSLGLTLTVVLAAAGANARPATGALAPRVEIADADGHPFLLYGPPDRPVLVVYEDRSSGTQNAPLKDDLSKLAADPRNRAAISLVPVADVSAYDFWPIRGFVAGAIRGESRRWGTPIYCDWSGAFRTAFDFRRSVSNVVLVGRDGRILFAKEGPLDATERAELLTMLRDEVGRP